MEQYVEFGATVDLPDKLASEVADFTREFAHELHIAKRVGLAGPNEIFDFVMSAANWKFLLPWAEKVLDGAAGYLGGYLTSRVLKSRTERLVDTRMDALETKIDKIIDSLNATRTPWNAHWDLRIGLKGGLDDADRAVIVSEINPEYKDWELDRERELDRVVNREDVARAILTSAILGPDIEIYMAQFRAVHGDNVRFMGTCKISDDGTLSCSVYSSKLGEHLQHDRWTVVFQKKPGASTEIIERLGE